MQFETVADLRKVGSEVAHLMVTAHGDSLLAGKKYFELGERQQQGFCEQLQDYCDAYWGKGQVSVSWSETGVNVDCEKLESKNFRHIRKEMGQDDLSGVSISRVNDSFMHLPESNSVQAVAAIGEGFESQHLSMSLGKLKVV